MAIGSVDTAAKAPTLTGYAAVAARNEEAQAKLDRAADERAQLEYLQDHLRTIKDALAVIRRHWRRSDDRIPAGAARTTSLAVLDQPGDESLTMQGVTGLANAGAGTLTINGTPVAYDASVDSLQQVIDRVNGAGAGAVASLDESGRRLVLASSDAATDLVLADSGGLLGELGTAAGTHRPTPSGRTPGMAWSRAETIAEAFGDAMAAINAIFADEAAAGEPASFLVRTRGDLQKAVEQFWAADTTTLARDIGLGQDFDVESGNVISFTERAEKQLMRALRNRTAVAEVMFFGEAKAGTDGLIGNLELRAGAARKRIETLFEGRGLSVDRYA